MLTPFERDKIRAIPIIPIEPAKEVKKVLPFLVFKLLKLSAREVKNDIDVLPIFLCLASADLFSTIYGSLSDIILPSFKLTIRVAYSSASSGLCVTITTSLSFATSFKSSIT